MQHDRALARAVLGHVGGIQPLRQHEIDLQRAALPVPPDRVAQHEFELGAVERPLPRVELVLDPGGQARRLQRALGPVPGLVGAGARGGAVGEFDPETLEPEIAVDRGQQLDEPHRLRPNLVLGAEDVGIVLGEGADAHDPVQRPGGLVAVAGAELGQPHRQLAIGA